MISDEAFVLSLGLLFSVIAFWAFKRLPHEKWQILASVPIVKDAAGRWHGLNFTYYGLLTANALVFGVAMLIILLGALYVPPTVTLMIVLSVLMFCLPAAKWVARLVEGKQATFTVAGAFLVGIFVAPMVLQMFNALLPRLSLEPVPVIAAMAAVMIAYGFGEGIGRLACISFGCCYGKPLTQVHPVLQKIFSKWHFVFSGEMKKIAYASRMEGQQVVPIQALTSILYVAVGLLCTWLFLKGTYTVAFVLSIAVTQGWRILSETLRADYRGDGKFSAYQIVGIVAIFYTVGLTLIFDTSATRTPSLSAGIEGAWHLAVVLSLQALWCVVFVFFGKSMVTGAEISFRLHHDRI